jgi:uridylate kinase
MTNDGKKFVISLGGSIAFPEKINIAFLRNFYLFIKKEIKRGNKFIIVAGGGNITRKYQQAAGKVSRVSSEDKDWIGIHATRLNAHLLRTIFKREANPFVFDSRFKITSFGRYPMIVASGWRPGWSTDYVAVQIAVDFKLKSVINLSKAAYVYTVDFQKFPEAKPIEKISWKNYLNLIPQKWTPGLHVPVDPVAAKLAIRKKIKVIVANGEDLNNLRNILRGKNFKGTALE